VSPHLKIEPGRGDLARRDGHPVHGGSLETMQQVKPDLSLAPEAAYASEKEARQALKNRLVQDVRQGREFEHRGTDDMKLA